MKILGQSEKLCPVCGNVLVRISIDDNTSRSDLPDRYREMMASKAELCRCIVCEKKKYYYHYLYFPDRTVWVYEAGWKKTNHKPQIRSVMY